MYSEIFRKRNCGFLRISTVRRWNEPFTEVLTNLGLLPNEVALIEITLERSKDIVTRILWKDLAYNSEIMPSEQARNYASKLIEHYYMDDCTIYTNSDWKNEKLNIQLGGWTPLTNSTFDSGVIVKHKDYCCCIWVEDED